MNRKLLIALCVLQACTYTSDTLAHTSGNSYEVSKEGYFIDIGYTPEVLVAGTLVRFDFSAERENSVSDDEYFTDLWVRIVSSEDIIFAGNIYKPEYGQAGMSMLLSEVGTYEMFVRFQDAGEEVVQTSFIFEVIAADDSSEEDSRNITVLMWLIAMALGVVVCIHAYQYICVWRK